MEYHGPGYDYSDRNDRRRDADYWLEVAYPLIMPLIVFMCAACVGVLLIPK